MLGQLMWIYEVSLGRDAQWLARESRAWLSQHCVAADGFAFALGCTLRDYANRLCDAETIADEAFAAELGD